MMGVKHILFTAIISIWALSGHSENLPTKSSIEISDKNLYNIFENPSDRYRPYVRWWWNGLRLDEQEILRELDLMKQIGIGGVEINSIRFPDEADSVGYRIMPYVSDDWKHMIQVAVDGCKERGLVCDMIGGSGWPFGGEFLTRDQQLQMLTVETVRIDGGKNGNSFSIKKKELLNRVDPPIMSRNSQPAKELLYIRLMPRHIDKFTEGINYDALSNQEDISISVPAGEHVLYFFVKMTGYMNVIEGAPGASGPVLNHFDKNAVKSYLERLSNKLQFNGPHLKNKVRAAFVDSFELEGANWNNTFLKEWENYFGYSLLPYLPYIIRKVGHMGDPQPENYGSEFSEAITKDIVQRVRNDFERFQIKLFQENFIETFNEWCHSNGLKSRIQTYGRALHPLESSMYIDIPECETWFQGALGKEFPDDSWSHGRAFSMVNKFVASGSLLAGNGRVSCEEITNVGEIFWSTLEEIKVAGDMSNISGVNHSILHGFNYSPKEAGFPGWIKYGAYFSEQNTLWPYFRLWFDYKARISAVLQNSIPQADIAILHPLEDMWSVLGQQRDPFPAHSYPEYAHHLWQNLHQNGNGCDYISEHIIQQAKVKNGMLCFGPRSYRTLLLMEVESLDPQTATMLEKFIANGGKIICIGKIPHQSVGFCDFNNRSLKVKEIIERISRKYPQNFKIVSAPTGGSTMNWYQNLQQDLDITPYVKLDKPSKWVFHNYYKSGKRDIFFITNFNSCEKQSISATFPAELVKKQAWIWLPETGERYKLQPDGTTLNLEFEPSESKLIVFDNDRSGTFFEPIPTEPQQTIPVTGNWKIKAIHKDGTEKSFEMDRLQDFNTLPFPWCRHFAGEIYYTLNVNIEKPELLSVVDAGLTHQGITELYINDEPIGVKWYGARKFRVKGKLKAGNNTITIKVVTTLGNYAKSLTNNPTALRFSQWRDFQPIGLAGPVKLY